MDSTALSVYGRPLFDANSLSRHDDSQVSVWSLLVEVQGNLLYEVAGKLITAMIEPTSVASLDNVSPELPLGRESLTNDYLAGSGYRLTEPIPLTLYHAQERFYVYPDTFVLYGTGATPQEAVQDYASALLDYYEDLRANKDVLAPHLREHLEWLKSTIAEG